MDTIAALATGTGGAIAVIRLSGPDALRIADGMFRPASGGALSDAAGYTVHYGRIVDGAGEMVDEVLASVFRAPRSYTGEDMVEISVHASSYICRRVMELLIAGGARQAGAGEFTVRAFLAGKMDLSQAEAVADMIASSDRASHALAAHQMRGGYSSEFAVLRDELLRLASLLELELDFSEEDVEFADRRELDAIMARAEERIRDLSGSFSLGNAIKEGVSVAITGSPNVGKSTLLNALLRDDRAMVSDIAGTTRDVIEESVVLDGIRFRFLDTAGLRHTDDVLERMGIERARSAVERARIILWVADAADFAASPETFRRPPFGVRDGQTVCLVLNKSDLLDEAARAALPAVTSDGLPVVAVSAKGGLNIGCLTDFLAGVIGRDPYYASGAIVSNFRHHEALLHASESLARARSSLSTGLSPDLLAEDIRQTLHHLGVITGQITTDEILGNIFSKFCIGK